MRRTILCTALMILMLAAALPLKAQETTPLEQPILISSAGQSADTKLVEMLAKKQKLDAKAVTMAGVSDLDGIKTLIIVPGFSSKGLGAAGVSQQQEEERVTALLKAAADKKIPVVMVHIGGKARRGAQSDVFNKMAADQAVHMVVVEQGDEDKYFSNIAAEKKVPIDLVPKIVDAATPLGNLFAK